MPNQPAPTPEVQSRLELATEAVREAGQITLRYFRRPDLRVETKEDQSPVTAADREAEQYLRNRIAEAFPEDRILGEEFGQTDGTSRFRWVLDPIDGTKSFVSGIPLYTVLIAVLEGEESRAGVIYAPATREMVYAAVGSGAWYVDGDGTPSPARVSKTKQIADALFVTSEVKSFTVYRKQDALPTFVDLQFEARLSRTWGDAYGYMMVATGRADIAVDPIANLWDIAPVMPIIEEAGGQFTDWNGRPTVHGSEGVATNGLLHEAVLAYTKGR